MTSSAFIAGFALGASLIVAIGAQNAFVLRQGLRREHVFTVAALCAGIDWALIAAGAVGFGTMVARWPAVTDAAAWGGALFLGVMGARAFISAAHPGTLAPDGEGGPPRSGALGPTVATTLAVSLLNPHVYLDTVVLLGGVAGQYPPAERVAFALGAGSASFMWFFGLAYGARSLAPIFRRPMAWRVLDVLIGTIMLWIAGGLVLGDI